MFLTEKIIFYFAGNRYYENSPARRPLSFSRLLQA